MYQKEQLIKYRYFEQLLKEKELSYILDPLTGLIARTYMIGFTKSLIEEGISFSYGIIDLDNFKEINDTYGHSAGDMILTQVSKKLIDYLDGYGLAGRYGGDEFLFVNTKDITYDDNKKWCDVLYETDSVLKKNYPIPGNELYVTGTVGIATYPVDVQSYDELFSLIDKLLYRGKTKGRNCYIIYVEAKHKNIVIEKLRSNNLYDSFKNLTENISLSKDLKEKMRLGYEAIKNDIHVTNMYYLGDNDELISVVDNNPFVRLPGIEKLITDNVTPISSLQRNPNADPEAVKIFTEIDYDTILITKITDDEECYGYLICTEPKIQRIWQEYDMALMYYFGRMLAFDIKYDR